MKLKSFIFSLTVSLRNSLISSEEKIKGKWHLFEYYTEPGNELIHFAEQDLRSNERYMEIHFMPEGECAVKCNFELPVLTQKNENIEWQKRRNYISFFNPEIKKKEELFQFAVDKNTLKLLKKNKTGKIQFFGFFKKPTPSKQL